MMRCAIHSSCVITQLVLVVMFFLSAAILSAQIPTYSEDVAPITYRKCLNCHRSGEIAPFALTNYSETKAQAASIKTSVISRTMPPWKADPAFSHFLDERILTEAERKIIMDWVDGDTPEGDRSKLPAPPEFPAGSQLGKPDLVLRLPVKWTLSGTNTDVYRNFVIPTGLTTDKTIAAIEVRPDNRKVVHHVLMWNDVSGQGKILDARDPTPGYENFSGAGFTTVATYPGWAPGTSSRFLPSGLGLKMYANSDLIVQMHYAPTPTDEEDQTSINIFFKKETAQRELQEFSILPDIALSGGYNSFVMPKNKVTTFRGVMDLAKYTSGSISVAAVFPHMHKLGKSAKLFAVTPKNDTLKLISIPDWDFHWQGSYTFPKLQVIPAASKIYYIAEYDNTTANPDNPNNPPKDVAWGFRSSEEMYLCYLYYVPFKTGDENLSLEVVTGVHDEADQQSLIQVQGINPQPSSEFSVLRFSVMKTLSGSIQVFNSEGSLVRTVCTKQEFGAGAQAFQLDMSHLPAGMYVCRLLFDSVCESIPFIHVP